MSNEDLLIDHDYVNVNSDDLNSIPSLCYQTISKGRVQQTDSACTYCCWNITEVLKAFVLPLFYTVVLAGCSVYCWQILSGYVHSLRHPIETLSYVHNDEYELPGISVFMFDNATFVSCEKGYRLSQAYGKRLSALGSKRGRSLSSLLQNVDGDNDIRPCNFSVISDYKSVMARQNTSIMVFEGPGNVLRREYMKIHFKLNRTKQESEIGFLEFFPFYNFSEWSLVYNSSQKYLQDREKLQDIWPLAVGFTTYSRLAIRVFKYNLPSHPHNGTPSGTPSLDDLRSHRTIFNPVNDIVKYLPPDATNYTPHYENMFAYFEWRDSEYEVIEQVVTQNLITTIGLMVTAVLTLLRMLDLTKVILRRQRIRFVQNRLSFYRVCTCCLPDGE